MATDWPAVLVQGSVQLLGTAIGGAIAAFTGFQVAERNAKAASQARATERSAQRDDYQRQVLTELIDALSAYYEAFVRNLQDIDQHGAAGPEAMSAGLAALGRLNRAHAEVRNQDLYDKVHDYHRSLLQLLTNYKRGTQAQTVESLGESMAPVWDAVNHELARYL